MWKWVSTLKKIGGLSSVQRENLTLWMQNLFYGVCVCVCVSLIRERFNKPFTGVISSHWSFIVETKSKSNHCPPFIKVKL